MLHSQPFDTERARDAFVASRLSGYRQRHLMDRGEAERSLGPHEYSLLPPVHKDMHAYGGNFDYWVVYRTM